MPPSDSLDLSVVYTATSSLLSTAEIDSGERFDTLQKTEELLAALPQDAAEAIILVGGIALLLWGQQYLFSLVSGEEYAALASDDLDFMGHKNAVILCAKTWGGEVRFPTMDDHTPQTAIISIPVKKDVFLIVDFLDKVFGIPLHNINKYCDKLTFGENEIYTLSPYLCLKSRICNLYGLKYDDKKIQRELVRIKLAASICRQYIIEHLDSGDPIRIKAAIGVAKYIGRNVFSTKEAIAVALDHGADFIHAIPEYYGLWPQLVQDRSIPIWVGKHKDKFDRLAKARIKYYLQKKINIPSHLLPALNSYLLENN